MKRFSLGKSILIASAFLSFFILSQLFFKPQGVVVQAQGTMDIDDVMQSLDIDLGIQTKEDVKQANRNSANEQNREDIQLRIQEELEKQSAGTVSVTATSPTATTTTTPPPPPPTSSTATLTLTNTSGSSWPLVMTLGGIIGFNGTLAPSPTSVAVTFLAVPHGSQTLSTQCNSTSSCGVLNISALVNVTCPIVPSFNFTAPALGAFNLNCTVP